MPDAHDDKLDRILSDTAAIKAALWPDPNQPGVLTKYGERLDSLEKWRSYLLGAWGVVTAWLGYHISGGK